MEQELKEIKEEVNSLNNKVNKLDSDFRVVVVDLKNQITNTNNFLSEISISLKKLSESAISIQVLDNRVMVHEKECAKNLGEKVNEILDSRLGKYTFYIISALILQFLAFYFFKK